MIVDYKIVMSKNYSDPEVYQTQLGKCHKRGADRILDLCRANGGVFIKVGQHIASLQYLLPLEYTSTLSILHSKAPESSIDDIRQVFKESIGKEVSHVC
jgi:aarF domain-containing kinase